MTLRELVKYLRFSILDDTGGSGIDVDTALDIAEDDAEAELLRWSNEELTDFINEAVRQVYRRILPVQRYEPAFNIPVVAGTAEYVIDQRILRIISARLVTANKQLFPCDTQDLWHDSTFETKAGTPETFLPDYNTGSIRLYPIPDVADTLQLFVNRLPLNTLSWSQNTQSPELREEFQIPMLWYAAFLAFNKDDANTLDPESANKNIALFNSEFPATSAYSDTRKRRTTHRPVSYGGVRFETSGRSRLSRRSKNPYGSC